MLASINTSFQTLFTQRHSMSPCQIAVTLHHLCGGNRYLPEYAYRLMAGMACILNPDKGHEIFHQWCDLLFQEMDVSVVLQRQYKSTFSYSFFHNFLDRFAINEQNLVVIWMMLHLIKDSWFCFRNKTFAVLPQEITLNNMTEKGLIGSKLPAMPGRICIDLMSAIKGFPPHPAFKKGIPTLGDFILHDPERTDIIQQKLETRTLYHLRDDTIEIKRDSSLLKDFDYPEATPEQLQHPTLRSITYPTVDRGHIRPLFPPGMCRTHNSSTSSGNWGNFTSPPRVTYQVNAAKCLKEYPYPGLVTHKQDKENPVSWHIDADAIPRDSYTPFPTRVVYSASMSKKRCYHYIILYD